MAQATTPQRGSDLNDEITERDIAIKAHQAASGDITAEEYFEAVRARAAQAVDREVARYEAAHPWWRFALGLQSRG
ncbi:hypothetical protein EDD92_6295 [Streptomyces sp. TLI_185]|nr:hypothetical protein EDD92_6295 [Streptomyces sp. TLI_185]